MLLYKYSIAVNRIENNRIEYCESKSNRKICESLQPYSLCTLHTPGTDWLIDCLLFYVSLRNILLICRRHHYQWRAAKFRPILGAQGHWTGKGLYRATPAVTRGLGFSGLIRRTAPSSCLLRHTRGCGGSVLTRILTGPLSVAFYDTRGCGGPIQTRILTGM
jgi:hypothetical protein